MTYSVEITEQAEQDLRGIYEYIAYELQSTQNAAAQLARLEKSIYSLAQMPERYRRYEQEPWHSRGWRIMPVDHYCVFYVLDIEHRLVNIARVLYGGRNMEIIFDNGDEESYHEKERNGHTTVDI